MSHTELDARNLLCPLPVIRAQDKIHTMSPGEILKVVCTDPGTVHDIPTWCRINGHSLLDTQHIAQEIIFLIEVGSSESIAKA